MVYVLLADGFEEIEAVTPIDILRRAGLTVQTVGVTGPVVTGAHGIPFTADIAPQDADLDKMDMLFLPGGGPGTHNLYASEFVKNCVRETVSRDKYLAAICAAPSIILGGMGLLEGKKATCYPGMEDGMTGAQAVDAGVCTDGKIITGRGVGSAIDFALTLAAALCGQETADKVSKEIVYAGA